YISKTILFKHHIESRARGSANQVRMALGELKKFTFKFPPLPVQKKIAAILSAYDDLIENNNRRIAILEKMAEEIYREWFVRLRFPGHEQVKFNKGIPESWERKRFDEFCLLQRGYDLPDTQVIPGQYPVIASTSIKTYHNQFKVNPPVITTGRSGSLGIILFINSQAWPLNTTLFVKNFYGNSPYLIYYTLKFLKLENFNSGAGVPTLNRNHLGGLYMSVPPKSLQNNFNDKIAILFKQKELLSKSKNALIEIRDRLLTRLISGKLSVEDLDIQFPPSMTEELK
ncbi:restriction endonuclease subunit S, partial [Trichormus variabilis FSR]